jgi:hypothetical protein
MREASERLGEPVEKAMRRMRVDERLTAQEIADQIGVPYRTTVFWIRLFGLTWPQIAAERQSA